MPRLRPTPALCVLAVALGTAATFAPGLASASAQRPFAFSAERIGPALRDRMTGTSWRPGCPVALSRLRYLRIAHWGFDRRVHEGELVVAAAVVRPLRQVFRTLYRARFPIRRMRLVDVYAGSDFASIEADNTSAFNCRRATGSTRYSEHAYGRAIDVNPIENPYVYGDGTTSHRRSRPYLDRSRRRPGMAYEGGVLVRAFDRAGWAWGGRWRGPTDHQHFSVSGR